jgi:hypothetical protein
LVRLVKGGHQRAFDYYEGTPEGRDEFERWLRASSAAPPALRESVHARLALSRDEDLPWVLRAIREQEEACMREAEAAQMRFNQARRLGRLGPVDSTDLRYRVRSAIMTDEVVLWNQMGKRLQRLRLCIERREEETETSGGGDDG